MSGNQAAFSPEFSRPIGAVEARDWYEDPKTIEYYSRATVNLGLWESEKIIFSRLFRPGQTLLDLGCGTGRIALEMWELGYRNLLGIDYSRPMIAEARRLARLLESGVAYRVGDATNLKLPDATFDGVIFGFNGLMQIPGRANRKRAMAEIRRVLVPGGHCVFTAHDRDDPRQQEYWASEKALWGAGRQSAGLIDFGDRIHENEQGRVFIHFPDRGGLLADLDESGLDYVEDFARAAICNETVAIRAFADDCRFWIVRRQP
jgi:SAM-dependent methyltransferase